LIFKARAGPVLRSAVMGCLLTDTAIKPGDRFAKTESAKSAIWVVTRVIVTPGVPRHFVLTDEQTRIDVRTISETTLNDPAFYRPVVAAPPPPNGADAGSRYARTAPDSTPDRAHPARTEPARTKAARPDARTDGPAGWLSGLGVPGGRGAWPSRAR